MFVNGSTAIDGLSGRGSGLEGSVLAGAGDGCLEGVRSNRLLDVHYLLWPEVGKGEGHVFAHGSIGCLREADATWVGEAFESCCNIHSIAQQVAAHHHVIEMNSDSELDARLGGGVMACLS